MKKFKLIGAAVSASLAFTMISAVAPAAAAQAILFPPNANGTDNSGFEIFACESGVHMSIPSTPSTEFPNLKWQSEYTYQKWIIDDNESQFGPDDIEIERYQDFLNETLSKSMNFEENLAPGTEFDLKLKFEFFDKDIFMTVGSDYISIPVTVQDSDAFAGGQGTKNDPYLVATVNQLNLVRCHDNKYFKLSNNLNMTGIDWNPIGQGFHQDTRNDNPWRGNFDGNGKTISNLTIETQRSKAGLFGEIGNSDISNLTLRNPNISGLNYVGAVVGQALHTSMSNVKVINGSITANEHAGLLVGQSDYRGNFSDISVNGSLFAFPYVIDRDLYAADRLTLEGPQNFGGVVGYDDAEGTSWYNIDTDTRISAIPLSSYELNLLESANDVSSNRFAYFGGFSGEMGEGAMVTNLVNKVEINLGYEEVGLDYAYIGGVFGDLEENLFSNIVSEASIDIDGSNEYYQIGGFSGQAAAASIANVNSKATINLEVGCATFGDECYESRYISGFISELDDDPGLSDVKSSSNITLVVVDDDAAITDTGGFIGYDDSGNLQRVISNSKINIVKATTTNNSLGIDGSNFSEASLADTGGFIGLHDDNSQYRSISSTATINVDLPVVENVGGLVGYSDDQHAMAIHDVTVRGLIQVPETAETSIGALVGRTGPLNLRRVIVSVAINGENPKIVGAEHDYYDGDYQIGDGAARSRINNSFFNSDLLDSQAEFPLSSRTGKQLKSAKFLKANGFDLTNIYNHKEGQFPVVRINVPFAAGSTGTAVSAGQSNGDTSISFGKLLSGGMRNYFVNLRNVDARKVASLVVFRTGKVAKTIASSVTNGVGNYAAASKYKLKAGDVLQVRISGKVISTLLVK